MRGNKRQFIVISLLVTLVAGPVFARVDDTVFESIVNTEIARDSGIQDLNDEIEERAGEVRDLEERLKVYEDNIAKKRQEQATLEKELSLIGDRIEKAGLDIEKNKVEIEVTQVEIEVLQRQIRQAAEQIDRNKELLRELILDVYAYDSTTPLLIAFTNGTLSDLYSDIEYTGRVQESMQETLNGVQRARESLETTQGEFVEKKATLSEQNEQLKAEEEALEGEEIFKNQILEQTEQSEEQFQALLAQAQADRAVIEGQIASLQNTAQDKINSIRDQIRARLADDDDTNDALTEEEQMILDGVTTFQWPLTGTITCVFHCAGYPFAAYIGPHSGLDIAVPMGTSVRAASSGWVTRAVWDGTSRLSWIMIVHNDGLASVYMHMSQVAVSVDDYVYQGDVIGKSGGLAGAPGSGLSTGPHLHFEIRQNGIPVDPMPFLP